MRWPHNQRISRGLQSGGLHDLIYPVEMGETLRWLAFRGISELFNLVGTYVGIGSYYLCTSYVVCSM